MDRESFKVYIKTYTQTLQTIYIDIAKIIGTKLDTLNYEIDRPKGKNKNVVGLMKDDLVEKIVLESPALRPKTCSYLNNDGDESKKAKQWGLLMKPSCTFSNIPYFMLHTNIKDSKNRETPACIAVLCIYRPD